MQFAETVTWIEPLNIKYGMGVDGIAALLVFLTTLLGVIVIIASWHYVKDREMGFFISLLLLQVGMVGVFCATDLFLFYVFWEAMLIPMYFIIGVWGGPRRIYAAIKFFLFTLIGSLLMLLAIIVVVYYVKDQTGALTFDIQALSKMVYTLQPAVLGVPRLLRGLRHQGADVPGAHLAPRRARRGAHGGLRDPGRRAPQDGRLRHAALLPALLPGRRRHVHPVGRRAVGDRDRVRRAGVAGAEGPQEARRLLEREPHGLRHRGHLRRHRPASATPPASRAPSSSCSATGCSPAPSSSWSASSTSARTRG